MQNFLPKTAKNYHFIVKIRVEPSSGRVNFVGEKCGGMWIDSLCYAFSGTEVHGGLREACGGRHKCKLYFQPFLMFMANVMRHVAVATSLGLRIQTSFFLSGGFHVCLVVAWAMEVSASVFFLPFFVIFRHSRLVSSEWNNNSISWEKI